MDTGITRSYSLLVPSELVGRDGIRFIWINSSLFYSNWNAYTKPVRMKRVFHSGRLINTMYKTEIEGHYITSSYRHHILQSGTGPLYNREHVNIRALYKVNSTK